MLKNVSKDLKRALTILGVIAVYFIVNTLPAPQGLSADGMKAIAMMICIVITWVTEVIPILVSSVLFIFVTYFIGLNSEVGAVKDFASPTVFFVFASILLAYALDNSGLNNRLALKLSILSKGNPKTLILLMMAGTALLSTIISNVPACACFFYIVLSLCRKNNCDRGTSNFAKSATIGVIIGAMVGGNATPAGSSLNVMGLSLLQQSTGATMSFTEWSVLGFPVVILSIPLLWLVLITIFPPEFKILAGMDETEKELKEMGPITSKEIKFSAITVLLLLVWFTEGTLHKISVSTSTVLISTLYFFPGIDLLTYEYVKDKLDWTLIIMIGAAGTFGAAMFNTGASSWIANTVLGPFIDSHPVILVTVIAAFCSFIKILIPSNPACVTILVPTLAAFAKDTGLPVMLLFLPMAFTVSSCWLLPFDPVPLICWPEKYFSIKDYFKGGFFCHIVLIVVVTAIVMFIGAPLGYF